MRLNNPSQKKGGYEQVKTEKGKAKVECGREGGIPEKWKF